MTDDYSPAETIPVSLVTGLPGSGKTTVLDRLLRHPELARTAVIINEFAEHSPAAGDLLATLHGLVVATMAISLPSTGSSSKRPVLDDPRCREADNCVR